ncbi:MAG: hypothetical protein A3G34_01435 [Candidatus Lindowbacteria bacterium RIFCSPLOWO2_12_FULL_62_27]|nr:MAG: hypothetical protein A3G34_01435 [Candidatus Lindowbacteria bacterium RIFCSPLOWO2_12_FULL_62_27]
MARQPVKPALVHLVTGFLGSGKTTFLRNALEGKLFDGKVAVLVNELGEVGIDGGLIKRRGLNTLELTNGCICCEIRGDFVQETEALLRKYKPKRLLIESTGIAEPGRILQAFYEIPPLKERTAVEPVICTVDARAFFGLMKEFAYNYVCQIKTADVVLLNKCDLVKPRELPAIEKAIREINPRVFIYRTEYCRGRFERLLRPIDLDVAARKREIADQAARPHADPFVSFVIQSDRRESLNRERLVGFLKALPHGVFRVKGYVNMEGKTWLLQYSTGVWDLEEQARRRNNVLVFIGVDIDRSAILKKYKKLVEVLSHVTRRRGP